MRKYILVAIIVIAGILRFYKLGQVPPSLYWDEVSNGYNAYSVLKTGRDEYGKFLPLVFRSFGQFSPALAIYPLVPSISVFGLNEIGVRFPSALIGTLTVFLTYFLALLLFRNYKLALTSAFFLAISPWHLQFSRAHFEANFMVFLTIAGLIVFLKDKKRLGALILASIFFGLALNSYHGAKIWILLFLVAIFFHFRKRLLEYKQKLIFPAIVLLVFSLPISLNFKDNLARGQSVSIFVETQNAPDAFVKGYLAHFSPKFLFVKGDAIGRHAVTGMGELYVFEIPLLITGLMWLITRRTTSSRFLLYWLLLAPIPASLVVPVPHALRSIMFLPVWSIISASGLLILAKTKTKKLLKFVLFLVLFLTATYNITTYLHLYYRHYPIRQALDWQDGQKEMVEYALKVKDQYDTVAISKWYTAPYIFVLFYSKYDPKKYWPQSQDKDGFDNFVFFPSKTKQVHGKTIYITNPGHPSVIDQIRAKNGEVIFDVLEL